MPEDPVERIRRADGVSAGVDPTGGRVRWFRAPGRVNLMGDHTDYEEGLALPVAIDRACVVASRPGGDRVHVRSLDLDGELDVPADGGVGPHELAPGWPRLAAGVIAELAASGRPPAGLRAVVASAVPAASGLASSAAFEVALALALWDAARVTPPQGTVAAACRRAEASSTGVPCGPMDQIASLEGMEGAALLLDCRTLAVRPVRLPTGLALLVVHSGLPRRLAESAYAERRAACRAAAGALGLTALRDATPAQVAGIPVARHVVAENARVSATAEALAADDRPALGRLMAESHASLRDDMGVSTPELDRLVEVLVASGAVGARLTGAGFGGCVVALCERRRLVPVAEAALTRYRDATGVSAAAYAVAASAGAGPFVPVR